MRCFAMAIGKRIRYFRTLLNLTQKELGRRIGFPERAADVRVAQYESETRVPKQDMIKMLSNILGVSERALTVPDIDTEIGLMHTFFALEDTQHFQIGETENGNMCIYLDKFDTATHTLAQDFRVWYKEYQKFVNGEITREEYDKWRYTFPQIEAERFKENLEELRKKKKEK